MSRLACLWVPLFPLAARLRAEPELAGEALAVTAGNGAAAQIVAATRAARRLGVTAGMTLVQARALVPKLAANTGSEPAGNNWLPKLPIWVMPLGSGIVTHAPFSNR